MQPTRGAVGCRRPQTHGRFRPDRIVCGPGTVTVDDFARSGPGDPARDVAELVFHLRRRALRGGDPGAIVLEPAFLDGYLSEAPEENLANVAFYAGCVVPWALAAISTWASI